MNDEQLFTEAYRRHFAAVESYVRRRASADSVQDVVAEVFTVAWRRWHEAPRDRLLPWLYGVARLTLANTYRDARRREALMDTLAGKPAAERIEEDHAAAVSQRLLVAAVFDALSPADQEVLRVDVWEGLSARDAAVAVGCSTAAFHVRLHRARRRFRQAVASTDVPQQRSTPFVAAADGPGGTKWGTR
ncbi:sigma-70 family RNA polymerase sigma factor [Streptomyces sp. NPDC048442]|uniref:RNA polymerase sigma factor n=1 Tax=Streptomyces sp. NPDC048442 TaxID=3154823 RepID=UPI00343E1831